MLTQDGCRIRQERFRQMLDTEGIDAAVVSHHLDVYWLTGLLIERFPVLLYIEAEGESWLICQTLEGEALVDSRDMYEPHLLYTSNPDPMRLLAYAAARKLSGMRQVKRLGWQSESLPKLIADVIATGDAPDEWAAIDDHLANLQRTKEPDEVDLMRTAIACSLAAYDADRAAIAPGVTELAVLDAGHRAATQHAGEIVFHSGDYQAGVLGGFARNRAIQAGELYVIDAWTVYRGYWSDLCRTFAVGDPTPLQQEVYTHIADILRAVPDRLKPGMRGTDLWKWIDASLREHPHLKDTGLIHHAGHSVGLRAHEMPDLNRDREGILEPGNVVSVEPGAYSAELNGGIRLENTFLITETGCELLSNYPLSLT